MAETGRDIVQFVTVAGLSLMSTLFVAPATAFAADYSDPATVTVGDITVTFGGGTALLTLPDVGSTLTRTTNTAPFTIFEGFSYSDDFGTELGWNVNGGVSVPLEGAGWAPDAISLNGFWARIDGSNGFTCAGNAAPQVNCLVTPLVDDPTTQQIGGSLGATSIVSNADRDVDQWGTNLELRWNIAAGDASPLSGTYFAFGPDVRGIYQDTTARMDASTGAVITYDESLDSTYYGAFAAVGGSFTPPLIGGLWQRWGLQSSFRAQGGLYWAQTDYDGRIAHTAPFPGGGGDPSGSLSLSSDDVSFIGGLSLETRKHFSNRVALSLKNDVEFYSFVPKMSYNQVDLGPVDITGGGRVSGTSIDSGSAFSLRSALRLTIGLGPDSLYR
ncbi:hypothetical protein [Breoghania sp.]|uniref:hypothetical protein n=1 Tax=Breoghania sp. TaxID=2065378 RepID=UPI002AAB9760|nr:hypothetical protein [Breoghania sp.]